MEPRPLTTWEQKERDGLLALETDAWRQKRLIAEDPNTTADVLEKFGFDVDAIFHDPDVDNDAKLLRNLAHISLLGEAVVAHPNTSPQTLTSLLNLQLPLTLRAFLQNPIVPFLCFETVDFWQEINLSACLEILSLDNVPRCVAMALTLQGQTAGIVQSARFHVGVAGELRTVEEGEKALTDFWKSFCATESQRPEWQRSTRKWHEKLVAMRLAPAWALGVSPFTGAIDPSTTIDAPTAQEMLQVIVVGYNDTPFIHFLANLYSAFDLETLHEWGASIGYGRRGWQERLKAALRLPLSDAPFVGDIDNRSPLDLMHYLAQDGNRLVRWAAQTRLADPNFVFTWHEGE